MQGAAFPWHGEVILGYTEGPCLAISAMGFLDERVYRQRSEMKRSVGSSRGQHGMACGFEAEEMCHS